MKVTTTLPQSTVVSTTSPSPLNQKRMYSKISNFFSDRVGHFKRTQPHREFLKEFKKFTEKFICVRNNRSEEQHTVINNQEQKVIRNVFPNTLSTYIQTREQIAKKITLRDLVELRDYLIFFSSRLDVPLGKSVESINRYLSYCQSINLSTPEEDMHVILFELETLGLTCLKGDDRANFVRLLETPSTQRPFFCARLIK